MTRYIVRRARAMRSAIILPRASRRTFLYRGGSSRVSPVLLTHLIKIAQTKVNEGNIIDL
jgi:hypothetical protein